MEDNASPKAPIHIKLDVVATDANDPPTAKQALMYFDRKLEGGGDDEEDEDENDNDDVDGITAGLDELEGLSLDAFSFSAAELGGDGDGDDNKTHTAADAVSAAAADIEERLWSKRGRDKAKKTERESEKAKGEEKLARKEAEKKTANSASDIPWSQYELDLDFSIEKKSGVDNFWGDQTEAVEATVAAAVAKAKAKANAVRVGREREIWTSFFAHSFKRVNRLPPLPNGRRAGRGRANSGPTARATRPHHRHFTIASTALGAIACHTLPRPHTIPLVRALSPAAAAAAAAATKTTEPTSARAPRRLR